MAIDRKRIVEGTAGAGGHLNAFLNSGASVLAFDRDPNAVQHLRDRFGDRITLHHLPFASDDALQAINAFAPDMIFLDLGISSVQIDDSERGFTFRPGAALDMRMESQGRTAADIVAEASESQLESILREFGDERKARRLAREIIRRRATTPFATSDDLVKAIRAVLGPRSGPADFARTFQAFRIAVNGELDQLKTGLPQLRDALVPGGLLVVISYHSGEDRVVKHGFRDWARQCICPPELPVCSCRGRPLGAVMTKSPITPREDEVHHNPRARSAKMRVFRMAS